MVRQGRTPPSPAAASADGDPRRPFSPLETTTPPFRRERGRLASDLAVA